MRIVRGHFTRADACLALAISVLVFLQSALAIARTLAIPSTLAIPNALAICTRTLPPMAKSQCLYTALMLRYYYAMYATAGGEANAVMKEIKFLESGGRTPPIIFWLPRRRRRAVPIGAVISQLRLFE